MQERSLVDLALAATARWRAPIARAVDILRTHRLLQFALVGGLTFAISPRGDGATVSLRRDAQGALYAAEARREGVARVSDEKAREIDGRTIEDEILYREGVRLGLDKDDGVIRQRVVQKTLFFAEELGGASRPPTDADLRAFFEAQPERWTKPPRIHLVQVFARTPEALAGLTLDDDAGAKGAGEASPIGRELDADLSSLEQALGADFAEAVNALRPGEWSAPIQSAYGWHRVDVLGRSEARRAEFDEVRERVAEAWQIFRRQEAVAAFVDRALPRYRIDVDGMPVARFVASRRVAFHPTPSAED